MSSILPELTEVARAGSVTMGSLDTSLLKSTVRLVRINTANL